MNVAVSISRARYFAREMVEALRLLWRQPAAGRRRIQRGVGVLRAALLFRDCTCGALVNASGHVRVVADGTIRVGDGCQFAGGMMSTELVCHEAGELAIGACAFFNYGVSVEVHRKVQIGDRCLFGSLVRVCDVGPGGAAPVVIGDDVWIAHGAIIEPGTSIGRGSVVAAGSVVCGAVPEHSLASGNPAVSVPLRREGPGRSAAPCAGAIPTPEPQPAIDLPTTAGLPRQGTAS